MLPWVWEYHFLPVTSSDKPVHKNIKKQSVCLSIFIPQIDTNSLDCDFLVNLFKKSGFTEGYL